MRGNALRVCVCVCEEECNIRVGILEQYTRAEPDTARWCDGEASDA